MFSSCLEVLFPLLYFLWYLPSKWHVFDLLSSSKMHCRPKNERPWLTIFYGSKIKQNKIRFSVPTSSVHKVFCHRTNSLTRKYLVELKGEKKGTLILPVSAFFFVVTSKASLTHSLATKCKQTLLFKEERNEGGKEDLLPMTVNNGVSLLFLSVSVPKVYNTLNGLRGFAGAEVAAQCWFSAVFPS